MPDSNESGTAEDRLTTVLTRLLQKTRREEQEQQPDMADLVFSFTSGDTTVALTTAVPQVAARVTFPCRLVSACVFESSEPAVAGSVAVDFRFRKPPTTAWATMTNGNTLGFAGSTRVDLDDPAGWQRFFEPGMELAARLVSVSTVRSVVAALSVRKLPTSIPEAIQLFAESGDQLINSAGDFVGLRRS